MREIQILNIFASPIIAIFIGICNELVSTTCMELHFRQWMKHSGTIVQGTIIQQTPVSCVYICMCGQGYIV
jgi:hypothetical protein